jgi:hypothetical protein
MAIWTRNKGSGDAPTPIEQAAIEDLAAPAADPDELVATTIGAATTHAKVARNRADKVVIGFTLSGALDALAADLAGFERTGDDRADLVAARQLDARAVHLGNQALAQQRENGVRAVTGVAGIYLATQPRQDR